MIRWLAALALVLGRTVGVAQETKMVDPKTLLFSLATINDALPATDAVKSGGGDLVLHEDDWRQFEAVSASRLPEVKAELADIQRIFREKSKPVGEFRAFTELHVRKRIPAPLAVTISWSRLVAAAGVEASSVSRVAFSGVGIVKNGFSFRVGGLSVFGIRRDDTVESLCFVVTSKPDLGENKAEKIAAFFADNQLVLVHWPSATLLDSKEAILGYLKQSGSGKK